MSTTPDFSTLVKEVRAGLGLSHAQFGQLIGVTPNAIFLWERGDRQPEGPALRLIYSMHQQLAARRLTKAQIDEVINAIAVGAAALALVGLLGALFSNKK